MPWTGTTATAPTIQRRSRHVGTIFGYSAGYWIGLFTLSLSALLRWWNSELVSQSGRGMETSIRDGMTFRLIWLSPSSTTQLKGNGMENQRSLIGCDNASVCHAVVKSVIFVWMGSPRVWRTYRKIASLLYTTSVAQLSGQQDVLTWPCFLTKAVVIAGCAWGSWKGKLIRKETSWRGSRKRNYVKNQRMDAHRGRATSTSVELAGLRGTINTGKRKQNRSK